MSEIPWFNIFVGYGLFAVATGIMAYFNIYRSLIKEAQGKAGAEWLLSTLYSRIVFIGILFLLSVILAPGVFFVTIKGPDAALKNNILAVMLGE